MFYVFNQNNTGGSFNIDDKVCHRLFIEADTENEAVEKASDLGVYFFGVEQGLDCSCCGDRWYSPDAVNFPYQYVSDMTFDTVEEYAQYLADKWGWTSPDARIYYKDNSVKEIFIKKELDKQY